MSVESGPAPRSLTQPHPGPCSIPGVPGQYPCLPLALQGPGSLPVLLRLLSPLSVGPGCPPGSSYRIRRPRSCVLRSGPGSRQSTVLLSCPFTVCNLVINLTDISWSSGWRDGWMDRQTGELTSFLLAPPVGSSSPGRHAQRPTVPASVQGAAWGHGQFPALRGLHTSMGTGRGWGP